MGGEVVEAPLARTTAVRLGVGHDAVDEGVVGRVRHDVVERDPGLGQAAADL
ncbi:hypothetical protein OG206_15345 [Streptomyces sp. NBC_01341]|uniref:hypothetical protein n=1 Tax=Streptomyces sp. NBC_01341 TaxID=2903831 RepID=UPI002E127328|nr:hypothetical protein OG206_15345 [Streptomyces sp. NBC_01341]